MLLLSLFFLFVNFTTSAKPLSLLFWGVIFVGCGYKLFLAKAKNT